MTAAEARAAIGQPFKLNWVTGDGAAARFDTIRQVLDDGTVVGDFIEAHAEDCRLKQAVPAGFARATMTLAAGIGKTGHQPDLFTQTSEG